MSALQPGKLVVGADQTLALGFRIFNKPADRAQAKEQQVLAADPRQRERLSARRCSAILRLRATRG